MLNRLFKPRPALAAGHALYFSAVRQARSPAFYAELGAPDTAEGRFELYSLHVYLVLERLKGQGTQASEVSQAVFDTYVQALDDALREMGVGDLSVGKKMRKLGEAFYGRVKAYEVAMAALPDTGPLQEMLARTVYEDADPASVADLAAYAVAQRQNLADQPSKTLCAGEVTWRAL